MFLFVTDACTESGSCNVKKVGVGVKTFAMGTSCSSLKR